MITCDRSIISVKLNGEQVTRINLDERQAPNRRPDGSDHKLDIAYQDRPRQGYIGLQDYGSACWFKNIKIRPIRH